MIKNILNISGNQSAEKPKAGVLNSPDENSDKKFFAKILSGFQAEDENTEAVSTEASEGKEQSQASQKDENQNNESSSAALTLSVVKIQNEEESDLPNTAGLKAVTQESEITEAANLNTIPATEGKSTESESEGNILLTGYPKSEETSNPEMKSVLNPQPLNSDGNNQKSPQILKQANNSDAQSEGNVQRAELSVMKSVSEFAQASSTENAEGNPVSTVNAEISQNPGKADQAITNQFGNPIQTEQANQEKSANAKQNSAQQTANLNEEVVQEAGIEILKSGRIRPVNYTGNSEPANQNQPGITQQKQTEDAQAKQGNRVNPDNGFQTHQLYGADDGFEQEIVQSVITNQENAKAKSLSGEQADSEQTTFSTERLAPVAELTSGHERNFSGSSGGNEWKNTSFESTSAGGEDHPFEFQIEDQIADTMKMAESMKADQPDSGLMSLGELTIQNTLLRKRILPGLSATLNKALPSAKETGQLWQKHSFDLEDGSKIELSTRNVDGVIQVKLAASGLELNKLLQQYENEIKNYLEQECELDIDLQFENRQQDENSGFEQFGKAQNISRTSGAKSESAGKQKTDQHLQNSVRKFGYNQMEWIA